MRQWQNQKIHIRKDLCKGHVAVARLSVSGDILKLVRHTNFNWFNFMRRVAGTKCAQNSCFVSLKSTTTHGETCRCNMTPGHVPATFSYVCTSCDFVPAARPWNTSHSQMYNTLLHVAATRPCNISPRVGAPSKMLTKTQGERNKVASIFFFFYIFNHASNFRNLFNTRFQQGKWFTDIARQ